MTYFQKELNVFTGAGTSDVFVNELTGVVNTSGSAAHVSANTADLILGTQCLLGDPTYYNTGNIIIGGDIDVSDDLAIIAGGNITTNQNRVSIRSNGNDIVIVAGANVVPGNGEIFPGGTGVLSPNHCRLAYLIMLRPL